MRFGLFAGVLKAEMVELLDGTVLALSATQGTGISRGHE